MENKYIRLLIDNTRFFMTESAEEIEYTRISPSRTGLPYDIYIDNNRSYKKHNHELWLYVKCDGVKIPITIEDKPKVKRFAYGLKCDLSPVYEFIRINKEILINMANRNTNEHVFFHLLQSVSENAVSKNDMITEMATLHSDISHLPTTLWLDDDMSYLPHAPRIKFRMNDETNTRQYTSMEINDPDRLHNVPKRSVLSTKQIEQIKSFVRVNKQILLDLCNNKIEFEEFKQKMKTVNSKGEVIEPKINFGKFVNGFAIYSENDKYNYIKSDGTMLFKETDLDYAGNFTYYGEDILLAFVVKDGREFYINDKGEEVKFD